MSGLSEYFRECFALVAGWLMETGHRGKLHLRPKEMSLTLSRKLMTAFRRAEDLLRLLIWELAAELAPTLILAEPRPRTSTARTPKPWRWGFRPFPDRRNKQPALEALLARGAPSARNRPEIDRLLARFQTLSSLAADPLPTARRMARRLARMKAARALLPVALPLVKRAVRLPTELSMIADMQVYSVNDAMRGYFFDTG